MSATEGVRAEFVEAVRDISRVESYRTVTDYFLAFVSCQRASKVQPRDCATSRVVTELDCA